MGRPVKQRVWELIRFKSTTSVLAFCTHVHCNYFASWATNWGVFWVVTHHKRWAVNTYTHDQGRIIPSSSKHLTECRFEYGLLWPILRNWLCNYDCMFWQIIGYYFKINTLPVKSLDTTTHSGCFFILFYFLHCWIIVKTSKLWNNT
jgi:hypothetical protein